MTRRVAVVALWAVATAACGEKAYEIDPFPVPVDLSSGVPIAFASTPELDGTQRLIVLDTATPLTTLDDGKAPGSIPTRGLVTFTLLSPSPTDPVPRARFTTVPTILAAVGSAGLEGTQAPIDGILGADILQRVAVRVSPAKGEVTFFPDIAGDQELHDDACEAVLSTPLRGGGNFVIGEETVQFLPSRLVVSACLAPADIEYTDAGDLDHSKPITAVTGRDALLVVATGVPITVITQAAYLATGTADMPAAPIDTLPVTRLFLPGGDPAGDEVRLTTIKQLALTARGDDENPRGSCMELAVSRLMERCGLTQLDVHPADCLSEAECPAGSTVEVGQVRPPDPFTHQPADEIQVAVVADTHPLIQGLRAELRPDVGEIDGLLGMDVLRSLEVDLDYPRERIILRCADPADPRCLVRPRMIDLTRRRQLSGCWRDRLPNDYLCSQ